MLGENSSSNSLELIISIHHKKHLCHNAYHNSHDALAGAIVSLAHAEELKASDVPNACKAICGPMVTLTNTCDVNPETETRRRRLRHRADDDGADDNNAADDESDEVVEAQCICSNTSFNVRSVAALCAACISQNGKTTDGKGTYFSLSSDNER